MTISVGDRLPSVTFRVMAPDGPEAKSSEEIFAGKRAVLFAVPGAFTPTCHRNHLPGYLSNFEAITAKGADLVAVTGVNDVFVMNAWAEMTGAKGKIVFLSDGNGDFARAVGLALDGSGFGLGTRSQRYAMIVDDMVVRYLSVEDAPSKAEASGAERTLAAL